MNCNFLLAILIILVECQLGALAAPSQLTHTTTLSTAEETPKPTPAPQPPTPAAVAAAAATATATTQPVGADPNGDSGSSHHQPVGVKRDSNAEKLKRGLTSFISNKNPAAYFVPIRSVYSDQVRFIQQQAAKINLDSDKTELIKLNDAESPSSQTPSQPTERDLQQQSISSTNLLLQQQQSLQPATEPPQQITGTQLMAEPSSLVNSGEGAINIPPRLVQTRPIGFVLRWGR